MKKGIYFFIFLNILLSSTVSIFAKEDISITINGEKVILETQPFIQNGRTLAPIMEIIEQLGAKIEWDSKTKTLIIQKGDTKIELVIEQKISKINEVSHKLDTVAIVLHSRIFIPLRFVVENLGLKVEWESQTKTIFICEKNDINLHERIKGRWYSRDYPASIIEIINNQFKTGWENSEWNSIWSYKIINIDENKKAMKIQVGKEGNQMNEFLLSLHSGEENTLFLHCKDKEGKKTFWYKYIDKDE